MEVFIYVIPSVTEGFLLRLHKWLFLNYMIFGLI